MSETPRRRVWEPDADAVESILAGLREGWAAVQAGDEDESRRILDELCAWYGYTAVTEAILTEISSGRNRHVDHSAAGGRF